MKTIIKFFQKSSFAHDFRKGRLYLNSVDYFRYDYLKKHIGKSLAELEKDKNTMYDIYECSYTLDEFPNIVPDELKEYAVYDARALPVEFGKVHLLCASNLRATIYLTKTKFEFPNYSLMSSFGNYVAVVLDYEEFLRRLFSFFSDGKNKFVCGNIHYEKPTLNGVPKEGRPSISFLSEDAFLKMNELKYSRFVDSFEKGLPFKGQFEWRFALYNSSFTTNPLPFEIGDLSDIVKVVNFRDLDKEIRKLYGESKFKFSNHEDFCGNIGRKEFSEMVLGNDDLCRIGFEIG